jgi:hypothetical protein
LMGSSLYSEYPKIGKFVIYIDTTTPINYKTKSF